MIIALVALIISVHANDSITSKDTSYIDACSKAVQDSEYFKNFRSASAYHPIVDFDIAIPLFVDYITTSASQKIIDKLPVFNELDRIGNPMTKFFPGVGKFSGATLRYIAIADEIGKLFELPENAKIVEVGGGFGGQCYVLSQLQPWLRYYIYDLPEPNALTRKMLWMLDVKNVLSLPPAAPLPDAQIDLFISNYAYSECSREVQLDYFDRLIKRAKRGYIIYNQISHLFSVNSLSPSEFMDLLEKNGMHPNLANESIPTGENTKLITWDSTK